MENRDSFFDFLDATAGQVEITLPGQVRRAHLEAMQAEAQRLQRAKRRLRYRGGLVLFSLLLVVAVAVVWLGDHHSVEPTAPHRIIELKVTGEPSGIEKRMATDKAVAVVTRHADVSSDYQGEPEATADASENRSSRAAVPGSAQPTPTRLLEKTEVIQRDGLLSFVAPKAPGRLPWRFVPVNTAAVRSIPPVAIQKNGDTSVSVKAAPKAGKLWFPGFSAGLHYTPEYMFNALDQTDRLVHNAGLEIVWTKSPFTVRSGVSVSVATGVTELAYSYNENLGTKQQLDSVLFTWDPQGRKIVPAWFFSEKAVFDTAVGMQTTAIRKRYTYLQIPLILGYDFTTTDRLSLGLRAGPVLQILIDTKQLDADPGLGNNRVISINQLTPGRLSTHWQGLVGLNASYALTRRLRIEFEPHVKYYFNSVYEKTTATRKPWSVELRTALMIKL